MKTRLAAITALTAVLVSAFFALPAAAANSTVVNTPVVTVTVYPGSAYDTATVTGDVNSSPGGTLSYTFFTGSGCTNSGSDAGTVPVSDGTALSSTTEGSLAPGSYSFDATYLGDGVNDASLPVCESFTIGQATPTVSITNLPTSGSYGGSFQPTFTTNGDGTAFSVTSTSPTVCSVDNTAPITVNYIGLGSCDLTANVAAGTNYGAASDPQAPFTIGQATPTVSITNLPTSGSYGGSFQPTFTTNGDGTAFSVTSTSPTVCSVDNTAPITVNYIGLGSCDLTANVAAGTNYGAASDPQAPFTIGQATPTVSITNLPTSGSYGGSFQPTFTTNGDGTAFSVTSTSPTVCSVDNTAPITVNYIGLGSCDLTANVAAGTNYGAASDPQAPFTIGQATPTVSITNLPTSGSYGGSFQPTFTTNGDGTAFSVTSTSPTVCSVDNTAPITVNYIGLGSCDLTANVAAGTNYGAASDPQAPFTIGQATPTVSITNLPTSGSYGGSFQPTFTTNGDGTAFSVTSTSPTVCSVDNTAPITVNYIGLGSCDLTANVAAGTNYGAASDPQAPFTIGQATPTVSITNLPTSGSYGGSFQPTFTTNGDGTAFSVTSNTPGVCTSSGLLVTYVGVGVCSLNAQVADGLNYVAGSGAAQTFTVGRATPPTPTITNIPSPANEFFGFTAIVNRSGDGATSVTSNTPGVCRVGSNGLTVTFVGFGTCSLTPNVSQGTNYQAISGSPQTFLVEEASHGYWLVGSDGGIFSFGTAGFHGSMGGTPLQRPVVGITPTSTGNGYWLVASDGGLFSFGDSAYYGSLPGLGFHPAGSRLPQSLNAPIVGMVPTVTGQGYFMVASDGGVFAFGDAQFEGSCPGIGGCAGAAVAVMPDRTGMGYWLVTNEGAVYAFGDASFYGAPPSSSVHVVDAVATPDGHGYWLLYANGVVSPFGDAGTFGNPAGYVNGFNPATAIFRTADGQGYWVAAARGDVFTYGDAPYLGGMSAAGLNGQIIAGYGF